MLNIEIETLEEFKKIIIEKDEEIERLFNEIKLETENMKKYFNTNAGNIITKGMIEYIEKQNNGLRQNSNVFVNKLDNAINTYKVTYADISESVRGENGKI